MLETAFNELERLGKSSKKGGSVVARAKDYSDRAQKFLREALRKHAQDTTIARATPAQLQARINNLRIKNTPGVSAQIEALERLLKIKAEWARAKDSALETKPSMTDLLSTLGIDGYATDSSDRRSRLHRALDAVMDGKEVSYDDPRVVVLRNKIRVLEADGFEYDSPCVVALRKRIAELMSGRGRALDAVMDSRSGAKDAEDPRMIEKQFFDLLRKVRSATKDKYGRISLEHAKQLKAIAAPYGAAYVSSPVEGRKTLPSPAHLSRTVRELYVIPEKRGESSHPFEKK